MTLQQAKDWLEQIKGDPSLGVNNPTKTLQAIQLVAGEWARRP